MSDQTEQRDRILEQRVEALAREIAATINAGEATGRDVLREIAVSTLRDEVRIADPVPAAASVSAARGFNPFGIGIPLLLMGAVLIFLFPPVGLLMFGAAMVTLAWGVGVIVLARH